MTEWRRRLHRLPAQLRRAKKGTPAALEYKGRDENRALFICVPMIGGRRRSFASVDISSPLDAERQGEDLRRIVRVVVVRQAMTTLIDGKGLGRQAGHPQPPTFLQFTDQSVVCAGAPTVWAPGKNRDHGHCMSGCSPGAGRNTTRLFPALADCMDSAAHGRCRSPPSLCPDAYHCPMHECIGRKLGASSARCKFRKMAVFFAR